ncbi:MAG: DUF2179 domain-containing protein [Bacteroidia bacterium]
MNFAEYLNPEIVRWVIIPLLIFCARLLDVSLGTLRIVFISRGDKKLAPFLGFFEVLIWIIAISQLMQHLTSPLAYISWAAGFAVGNYIGLRIEQKLALGQMIIRIITPETSSPLAGDLKKLGLRVNVIDGMGNEGKISILFSVVKRRNLPQIIALLRQEHPHVFYTLEDLQEVSDPVNITKNNPDIFWRKLIPLRKAK